MYILVDTFIYIDINSLNSIPANNSSLNIYTLVTVLERVQEFVKEVWHNVLVMMISSVTLWLWATEHMYGVFVLSNASFQELHTDNFSSL